MILLNILWLYCREEGRMEGKGVAAAAALCCMLVMLSVSGQQQVAGFTGFCGCFGSCYPACREGNPAWLCTIKCMESCTIDLHEVPVAAFGAGDCSKICLSSICSVAERGDGKRRLLLHSNLALINFVFAYKFFIFLCPCIWICQGQLMPVLQQLALMIAP